MTLLAQAGPVGEKNVRPYTGPAGTVYGKAVVQTADTVVAVASSAGEQCIGIVDESDVANTGILGIVTRGECIAIAGAAVTAPAYLKTNAAGLLIPVSANGDNIVGIARSSCAGTGDEIVVDVIPSTYYS